MAAPVTAEIGFHLDDIPMAFWMTYSPDGRLWRVDDAMATESFSPFSWASRLTILSPDGTEIARYGMTGSSAAREAIRRGCGL